MSTVVKFDTAELLALGAADLIVKLSSEAIKATGHFTIALSGGTTPAALFALLAKAPYDIQIDWKNTFVFWGDERCVPADNDQNNSYNARKILLDVVPIPQENIFAIPTEESPADAALEYEETIKAFFDNSFPAFDLILLGMGDNGHTASLFPHTSILKETKRLVKEVHVAEVNMDRISFTAPFINNAKHIVFLIAGKAKAAMLKIVLEGPNKPEDYPAQMIRNATWYVSIDQ